MQRNCYSVDLSFQTIGKGNDLPPFLPLTLQSTRVEVMGHSHQKSLLTHRCADSYSERRHVQSIDS